MVFTYVIINDAILLHHVILWTHQSMYVRYVIFQRQSLASFIACNTHSILAALLKPTICSVFPHIEIRSIEVIAKGM